MVPGELGFKKGEVITVVERAYDDFWRGHLRGKYGFFPVEFVVRCSVQLDPPDFEYHVGAGCGAAADCYSRESLILVRWPGARRARFQEGRLYRYSGHEH